MDKSIFCTLTEAELVERRRTVLASLQKLVCYVQRLPAGFAYEFPNTSEVLSRISGAVELERQCCGFLAFNVFETQDRIRLEITGPAESVGIIEEFFGESAA